MAEQKRDYYEVLGVAKNAGDGEIKKAYRVLAKKYHPDMNPGDKDAEKKFKEASEAYAILSDPEKRRQYDQFGHAAFEGGGGGAGGGEGSGVVHPNLNLAHQGPARPYQLGGGHRFHRAGEGLHGAGDGHLGALAGADGLGVGGVEGEHYCQGGGVGDLGDGGAGGDQVPPLDQHLLHHPGPAGPDGEVGGQVVVALLGLTD